MKQDAFELIMKITKDLYIPFSNIQRAIPWPNEAQVRNENDAEHSFSLALISASLAKFTKLNADTVAAKSIVHDLVERYAGDTSAWDKEGLKDKKEREHTAFMKLKQEYGSSSWMIKHIEEYENLATEADRFVYALDKLVAVIMLIAADGHYWKSTNRSYQDHIELTKKKRKEVAVHPLVLEWYDQVLEYVSINRNKLFNS